MPRSDLLTRARTLLDLHTAPEILVLATASHSIAATFVSTGPYTQRVALTALQDATSAMVAGGVLPESTRDLN